MNYEVIKGGEHHRRKFVYLYKNIVVKVIDTLNAANNFAGKGKKIC